MNVSKIKIAIKNSLTLTLTLLIQEMIQIGVINVVKTIKRIDIPSTPNLNFIKLFIQDFSLLRTEIQKYLNPKNTTKIMKEKSGHTTKQRNIN